MSLSDIARQHVRAFWPNREQREHVFDRGPILRSLPGFRVCSVRGDRSEPWVYVSIGASRVVNPLGEHLELFVMTRAEEPTMIELLAMASNLHADPRFALRVGSTMRIGRPWLPGSTCDRLLVSLPYPFGPSFEICDAEGHRIRFLWLLPITEGEEAFLAAHGLEALERRFDEQGIDAVDPVRASVA